MKIDRASVSALLLVIFVISMLVLIPLGQAVVLTPYEWIYWFDGGIAVFFIIANPGSEPSEKQNP